jgi:hypothetical protein
MTIQDYFSDGDLLRMLVGLAVVVVLAWGVRFVLKELSWMRSGKNLGKMTRVLDVCPVEGERKILLFSCPFSQGMILISPKGDQVILFDEHKDFPSAPKK